MANRTTFVAAAPSTPLGRARVGVRRLRPIAPTPAPAPADRYRPAIGNGVAYT